MEAQFGLSRTNRRVFLQSLGIAGAWAGVAFPGLASERGSLTRVLKYLESLARPDGGYGWEDQEHSHLTPTYAVIGCYHVLKQRPPNSQRVADFVRTHHPGKLKKLEQERRVFVFQQVQALAWLGADLDEFKEPVKSWKQPVGYLKQYERHGYPVMQSELGAVFCRPLVGLSAEDLTPHFTTYLDARRRPNGSFNNTPAADGGDGHVLNTWWGLRALAVLGREKELADQTAAWFQDCQLGNGAFTWQPKPEFAGIDDVAYTWAAVRSLQLLGSKPKRVPECVAYLQSLANPDGGCSDRPGWLSNPLATFYCLDALAALGVELRGADRARAPRAIQKLPDDLGVFSIQIEAHGQGSPAEAVDLARALRIHLWGAKNASPAWIAKAQSIAHLQKAPVKFFRANEEYGTWVDVPGLGTYSHTSDIVAPAGTEIGPSLAQAGVVSWPEFRSRRLEPLMKGEGRLLWQFGENEELVRLFLDDSIERGGYAAISTFHFGNPDFTNSEPFLQRWRGQIPFVALQDAHGPEPWWFADMTTGFRTVFLARRPDWGGWLNALKNNWVAAIRHDRWSGEKTWIHAGSAKVLAFIREREGDWRWWNNPEIARPMVSIVPVRPEDQFETGRPDAGVALRIRCAWENTAQGMPLRPITRLAKLVVDDLEVKPTLVEGKSPRGAALADHYHLWHMPKPEPGRHAAVATAQVMDSFAEVSRKLEFTL